jgi:hypothetical protein
VWGLRLENGEINLSQLVYTPNGIGVIGDIRGDWQLKK